MRTFVFYSVLVLDSYWCSRSRSIQFRVFAAFLMVLFVGLGVELIQLNIADRFFSWSDVIKDLSGGAVALLWKAGRKLPRRQSTISGFLSVAIVFINFIPLGVALADEYRSYKAFPLLAGFEDKVELSRWGGARVGLCMAATPRLQGRYSGKIILTTDEYSGVSSRHFPVDWSGRNGLAFNVYNPGQQLTLHYRIHDHLHQSNNQTYADRFNGTTVLGHGWNEIVIPMTDIINGPQNRKMEITNISGFGIFVMKQPDRRVLFLDNVRLL